MKTVLLGVICAVGMAGCFPVMGPRQSKPAEQILPAPPPPVTADQVTERNAHQQLRALEEELDRARRELPSAPLAEGSPAARRSQ